MKNSEEIGCIIFPCKDVDKSKYMLPKIDINPLKVKALMISEASPQNAADYYYSEGEPLFARTTLQAFRDAGLEVDSFRQLIDQGFYFTTAVKCGKTGYGIEAATIKECSLILEKEVGLFPNLRVVMLMGDVAIKAFNEVARRKIGTRAIPAGSTYKIRKIPCFFNSVRVFPSYLQAGPSFFIEKSKRAMIAEDIAGALDILG